MRLRRSPDICLCGFVLLLRSNKTPHRQPFRGDAASAVLVASKAYLTGVASLSSARLSGGHLRVGEGIWFPHDTHYKALARGSVRFLPCARGGWNR
jgi:hypothetical protein